MMIALPVIVNRKGSSLIEYLMVIALVLLCAGIGLSTLQDNFRYSSDNSGFENQMRRPVRQALK